MCKYNEDMQKKLYMTVVDWHAQVKLVYNLIEEVISLNQEEYYSYYQIDADRFARMASRLHDDLYYEQRKMNAIYIEILSLLELSFTQHENDFNNINDELKVLFRYPILKFSQNHDFKVAYDIFNEKIKTFLNKILE